MSPITKQEDERKAWEYAEIFAIRGKNTRDDEISLQIEEMTIVDNFLIEGRKVTKRKGSASTGSSPSATKALGLGHLEQDSGQTLLLMLAGTLYKLVAGTWTASDKTDYNTTAECSIITFTEKSGAALVTSTSTNGTTKYIIEDTNESWTENQYAGKCVTIEGETKYIESNTGTTLILSDRLDNDNDSDYQGKGYTIHEITPFAIVANGVDDMQKYDLTDHTAITGVSARPFKYITAHQGRLFGATDEGDDNDRVNISDVGLAGTFTKDLNTNVNLQFANDGDTIKGLVSFSMDTGAAIIVPKQYSTHIIEGLSTLEHGARPILQRSGCASFKTLKVSGKTAFMLNMEHEVIQISGEGNLSGLQKPVPVSDPISTDLNAESDANIQAASAAVWDNKYILSVGDSVYVYDILESLRQGVHVWYTLDFPFSINIFHAIGDILYAGDTNTGAVYQLFTGDQDFGSVNIVATLETGAITFPDGSVGIVDQVEMYISKQASTIVRMQFAIDGGSYGTVVPRTLDQDSKIYTFPVKTRCKSIKFKFVENGSNAAIHIALPFRIRYAVEGVTNAVTKSSLTNF